MQFICSDCDCHLQQWSTLGVDPLVEYVPSAANLSDLSSRCEYSWLLAQGASRVSWAFPPMWLWEDTE